jgi:hypothetical protein
VCALGTVGTVFRTSAGLNGEEFAELYLTGPVVLAMDLLRFKDQFKERLLIDFTDLFPGPVAMDF